MKINCIQIVKVNFSQNCYCHIILDQKLYKKNERKLNEEIEIEVK